MPPQRAESDRVLTYSEEAIDFDCSAINRDAQQLLASVSSIEETKHSSGINVGKYLSDL